MKLQDRKTGRIIFVFNAHTHPEKASRAVKLIQKKIKAIAEGNPIILVGDFNFDPGSEAHELITGLSGNQDLIFQDSFVASKIRNGPEATHGSTGLTMSSPVDHSKFQATLS